MNEKLIADPVQEKTFRNVSIEEAVKNESNS